jgi:hypothetical protein
MAEKGNISRREFVASAVSVAAVSALPVRRVFARDVADGSAIAQTAVTLTETPSWKDQGVENLAKSAHAKLSDIPVHAVTITGGFWAPRREISATKSS